MDTRSEYSMGHRGLALSVGSRIPFRKGDRCRVSFFKAGLRDEASCFRCQVCGFGYRVRISSPQRDPGEGRALYLGGVLLGVAL